MIMRIMINSGRITPFFTTRLQLLNMIKERGGIITLGGFETTCIKKCEDFGADFVEIPFARAGMNPLKDLTLVAYYYKIMKNNHFDIVHSYTAKPNIYGTIAAWLAGVKKIYPTVNGLGYAFTGNSFKNKCIRVIVCVLYKIAFCCATRVFFQNIDDINELTSRKVISKDKCVLISGSGIDLNAFTYEENYQKNTFLFVSRLLITKGIRIYIKAAEKVKHRYPDAIFRIAGSLDSNPDGIKKEELQHYIDQGIVEYLGHIDDIHEVLKNNAVLVLPSFYREGVPHSILEAMSTGRAIITTNLPGCKETVNKKNGFLIEPHNSDQLAEKMIWMLENPDDVRTMGIESRNLAEEKFDVIEVNKIITETMGII